MNARLYNTAVSTDKGLIRGNNEDNYYFNGKFLTAEDRDISSTFTNTPSDDLQIYGVFDGMGGEALGEVASLISAQTLAKCHDKIVSGDLNIKKNILNAIDDSNMKICKKIIESGEKRIGATFSALTIDEDKATVYNVGDSRVYLFRNNALTQISIDDTSAQRLVKLGVITEEQAKTHKDRHKLTQHLGIFKYEMIIEPHVSKQIEIETNDKFLLCSDGLTDMVSEDEIVEIMMLNANVEEISKKLVDKALKNGGHDNVTVVVIEAKDNKKGIRINKKKFILPICILCVLMICVAAFSFMSKDDEKKVVEEQIIAENIYFSNYLESVSLGDENTIMVAVEPAGVKEKVEFYSSNEEIIEIDKETGFYKAKKQGNATIFARLNDLECQMEVEVYIPIEDITKIPERMNLYVGDLKKVQYALVPENTLQHANFVSENEEIVTVTRDGIVEGIKEGKTNIIVFVKDYQESISVVVSKKAQNAPRSEGKSGSSNEKLTSPQKPENVQNEPTNTEKKDDQNKEENNSGHTILDPDKNTSETVNTSMKDITSVEQ